MDAAALFQPEWIPREKATLCFLRGCGQILLIRKKRGLGAGKINAPGGRIEPGETSCDAAIRETREEVGLTPLDPVRRAELRFQFTDGYSLCCAVFLATKWSGEVVETPEAVPLWTPDDAIPWDEMWEDDRHWLPRVLAGEALAAAFLFDGERMLNAAFRPLAPDAQ